jgi:hypothetical protein
MTSEDVKTSFSVKNISENSSTTIKSAMHMLANAAEMTIFLFLGVFTITSQMQVPVLYQTLSHVPPR